MLVALSGVQGSGKTTVLNGLKDLGFNVIERKTARSVLAEWNTTLEDVYADQEMCKAFHETLLSRKIGDEAAAKTSNDLWFTERSYADLFTYAMVTLGHFNKYSKWLDDFYDRCQLRNEGYLAVCFLNQHKGPTEHDGVRGTNQHYVRQVDMLVEQNIRKMCSADMLKSQAPLYVVPHQAVDERVRWITTTAMNLWLTERLHVDAMFKQTSKHPERIGADLQAKRYATESSIANNNI